jgi:hypothetical protein
MATFIQFQTALKLAVGPKQLGLQLNIAHSWQTDALTLPNDSIHPTMICK